MGWTCAAQVAPKAAWLPEQRELQWDVTQLHSGAALTLRALLPAEPGGQPGRGAQLTARFRGPPDETLSGLTLESGPVHGRLQDSSSRLHGRATAMLE